MNCKAIMKTFNKKQSVSKKLLPLLVLLMLCCCSTTQQHTADKPPVFPQGSYWVNYGGCLKRAELTLKNVGKNLYTDQHDNLYFLTYDRSDETGKNIYPVFIMRFENDCADYLDKDTVVDFSSYDLSKHIDVSTFESLGDVVYKDKKNYYYHTITADGGHLSIMGASTFAYIDKDRASDGKMYINTAAVNDGGKGDGTGPPFYREVPEIDVSTFINLGQEGWYAKDAKHVYIDHFMTDSRHLWLLEEADAATFQSIGYRWGKDKNHVFENGIMLEGLHPDSMIILCPETTKYNQVFFSMVKDRDQVFCGYTEMKCMDAKTFECIASDSIITYRDKNWVYNEHYFPNMEEKNRRKRN